MFRSLCMYRILQYLSPGSFCLMMLTTALPASAASSWDGNRWFQIEISIFTNEMTELQGQERFTPDRLSLDYPARLQALTSYADLLAIRELEARLSGALPLEPDSLDASNILSNPDPDLQRLMTTGPSARQPLLDFRLPDPARDAFLLLPPDLSDFLQTNRALERSGQNRLLFHGNWRQPVLRTAQSSALIIEGGQQFAGEHELQGNLTIRFNDSQDRVVIDTDLWLIEFATQKSNDLDWPELPQPRLRGAATDAELEAQDNGESFVINRIVQFNQSRDMRSNEFHYLDHPLLGIVISVKPYDLPLPVLSAIEN